MKKFFAAFCMLVLMTFMFTGCKFDKDDKKDNNDENGEVTPVDKISLNIGDMNASTYIIIDNLTLNKMISDKESFVLFVYQEGCKHCERFKPVLESAISERHLIVYAISYWSVETGHEIRTAVTGTPSMILYKEGVLDLVTDPGVNYDYFSSKNGLLEFFDTYTYMPTAYYINKSQLDEMIVDDNEFIVYFSRKSCSDCSYLNRNYLKEYLKINHDTKHFYIIETDAEGIRYTNGQYDADLWQSFKDSYGLSSVNNPIGHGVGYVPTLQYYEDGIVKEMMVYFNDCEYVLNEDGSYSVVINNSYYEDNPYIGQTLTDSEYRGKLEGFYNAKLKSFLDTNLVKVD